MADHYDKSRRSYVLQSSLLDYHGFQEASRRHGPESHSMLRKIIVCFCLCVSFVSSDAVFTAQSGANGEWRTYGADLGNSHYSPLDQITAINFNQLQVAWRFKTESLDLVPKRISSRHL